MGFAGGGASIVVGLAVVNVIQEIRFPVWAHLKRKPRLAQRKAE
jgi:hypothetical protein